MMSVVLRLLRDRDEAEDVVQEAMMKVCRYIGRFEGRASFSTWLHRIATNAAVDRLRLRRHLLLGSRPDNDTGDRAQTPEGVDERTPESQLGQAQSDAVVRGAIGRLSLSHQQVLVLREFDGESYQQIARSAKCPVGTVMSRLHHARRKLTEELAQELDAVGVEAA